MNKIVYSSEQLAGIEYAAQGKGNFAFRARAGTGKSQTGCRIVEVTPAESWVYIQFMKRGQVEMESRISDRRGESVTFNAICNRALTKNWGFCQAKSFWAEANRVNSIDSACKDVPLNQVTKLIGALKCEIPAIPTTEQAMEIALKYGIEDCEQFKFSLDEIVSLAVKAIPLSLERPSGKYRQISWEDQIFVPVVMGWLKPAAGLVLGDEFQDFNPVQHQAFLALSKGVQAGILFDDRQQIYAWRGAKDNGAESMVETLSARVFPLTVSRRCARLIVEKSQSLVPDFKWHEDSPQGEITTRGYDEMTKLAKVGDAIESRTNAPLMSTCFSFIRQGITSKIEGRDIGAQLESVIKQTGEDYAVIPFLDKLETWVQGRIAKAKGFNASATIDYVTDQAETLKVLAENCNMVPDMVAKIKTIFEDSDGNEKPSVKCTTVHKAKGLEWNKVFILNDSFKKRSGANATQTREEENIQYVAWTRAKTSLNFVNGLNKQP